MLILQLLDPVGKPICFKRGAKITMCSLQIHGLVGYDIITALVGWILLIARMVICHLVPDQSLPATLRLPSDITVQTLLEPLRLQVVLALDCIGWIK